jgi:hypothetical protein
MVRKGAEQPINTHACEPFYILSLDGRELVLGEVEGTEVRVLEIRIPLTLALSRKGRENIREKIITKFSTTRAQQFAFWI